MCVKQTVQKAVCKARCLKTKATTFILTNKTQLSLAFALMLINPITATASGSMGTMMDSSLGVVFSVFKWVGVFIGIFGIISLLNATKNENGDKQQSAIIVIGIGAAFLFLEDLVEPILTSSGLYTKTGNTLKPN